MITRLFTFGYGHVCPFTGKKLDDHYATITAATEAECTALMVHLFGTQWAFPYDTPEAAGVDRFGLTEHVRLELAAARPDPEIWVATEKIGSSRPPSEANGTAREAS